MDNAAATVYLVATHCALDDGDINAAGRALFHLRRAVAEGASLSAETLAWLSDLDSLYHACI